MACDPLEAAFTCGGEEQWEQRVMTCGRQNQEDPSILSALNRQDATEGKTHKRWCFNEGRDIDDFTSF